MEKRLLDLIELGSMAHKMLPIDETETMDYKLRQKR